MIIGKQSIIYSTVKKHLEKRLEFPWEDDLSGVAFSLIILAFTYDFHPITIVDGNFGNNHKTKNKLTYDDVNHIVDVCLNSTHSVFDSGIFGEPYVSNPAPETKHYALAIEWLEAAEMLVSFITYDLL